MRPGSEPGRGGNSRSAICFLGEDVAVGRCVDQPRYRRGRQCGAQVDAVGFGDVASVYGGGQGRHITEQIAVTCRQGVQVESPYGKVPALQAAESVEGRIVGVDQPASIASRQGTAPGVVDEIAGACVEYDGIAKPAGGNGAGGAEGNAACGQIDGFTDGQPDGIHRPGCQNAAVFQGNGSGVSGKDGDGVGGVGQLIISVRT